MRRCNGIDDLIGPRLANLIATQFVQFYNRTVIVTAADGVEVQLGTLFDKKDSERIESYLKDHPTPDTW